MRKEKRLAAKIAKVQNRVARLQREKATKETIKAELQEKIANVEAESAVFKDILDRGQSLKNVLQKRIDGIPLLPDEEAMLNSSTKNPFVKGSGIRSYKSRIYS